MFRLFHKFFPPQDSLLLMLIPLLGEVKREELSVPLLEERPRVLKLFLSFLVNFLLLPYGSHPSTTATDETDPTFRTRTHPCLSESDWRRAAGETPSKAEELERRKAGIVRFLVREQFNI